MLSKAYGKQRRAAYRQQGVHPPFVLPLAWRLGFSPFPSSKSLSLKRCHFRLQQPEKFLHKHQGERRFLAHSDVLYFPEKSLQHPAFLAEQHAECAWSVPEKWYRILRVPWEHPHTAVPYDPEYQSSYSKRDSSPPVPAFAEIPRQYARAALSTVPPRPVQCKSHRKYGNMLHLLLYPYNIFSVLQTVSKAFAGVSRLLQHHRR